MLSETSQISLAAFDRLKKDVANAFEPPTDLTVSQWADLKRILPQESSSEPGLWRTARFPFTRKIMDDLSPQSPVKTVAVMKGAQLGFTEVALNLIMYCIDHEPCPLLYVQKTVDNVEKFSKQRFDKSVSLCPSVQEKIGGKKKRDSSNTILIKSYPGGIVILGGANSAASLRSMPIRVLILDEEDSYEDDIQEEGTPSEIAIRRTANFPNRKVFHLSTPAIQETSKIEPAFEDGTKEYYQVPCPFCGGLQIIRWENIIYKTEKNEVDLDNVYLRCVHCNGRITEQYKNEILVECEDYTDSEAPGARWVAENPDGAYPSYHLSSLYSPLGFFSWREAVEMWLKIQKTFNKELLKVFVNTVLGETFTESNIKVEYDVLAGRKERYDFEVPDGVLILTAGVDVQNDRIEVEVLGSGVDQETWSIDYATFMGDTEQASVWQLLDQYLLRTWNHAEGPVNITAACVDTGYRARVAYNFCRIREHRRIFPIKGWNGFGKGYIERPSRRNKDGVYLFKAFVDELKSKIYSYLKVEQPGPGYCHFPRTPPYSDNYFRMLTAERLITKRVSGRNTLQWDLPKGRRNEALDCRAYAIAALNIVNPNFELLKQSRRPLVLQSQAPKRRRRVSAGVA